MDSTSAVEKILVFVKPQYEALKCWIHRWPHIHDVMENAKKLAELENGDIDACVIAALCHDLGRIEEETRKLKGQSPLPHALLSIEPTIKILQQVGISGIKFNEIVEAVAVHSYKDLDKTSSMVARILQDADKLNGFGPYGIIGAVKYFGGKDLVDPAEIQDNRDNRKRLIELCDISVEKADEETLRKTIKGLGFVLEWYDMLHTKSAKEMIREEYEYTKQVREDLIKRSSR
jgi:HD superfamily phosphodiesterase